MLADWSVLGESDGTFVFDKPFFQGSVCLSDIEFVAGSTCYDIHDISGFTCEGVLDGEGPFGTPDCGGSAEKRTDLAIAHFACGRGLLTKTG